MRKLKNNELSRADNCHSNFNIHPYLGYSSEKPSFIVNHNEVDELILLPLNAIFAEENHSKRKLETRLGTYVNDLSRLVLDHVAPRFLAGEKCALQVNRNNIIKVFFRIIFHIAVFPNQFFHFRFSAAQLRFDSFF